MCSQDAMDRCSCCFCRSSLPGIPNRRRAPSHTQAGCVHCRSPRRASDWPPLAAVEAVRRSRMGRRLASLLSLITLTHAHLRLELPPPACEGGTSVLGFVWRARLATYCGPFPSLLGICVSGFLCFAPSPSSVSVDFFGPAFSTSATEQSRSIC